MPTRTDLHRPAALVTEDYTYLFCYDNEAGEKPVAGVPSDWLIEAIRMRAAAARLVRTSEVRRGTGQCHHCGAHIRWGAVLRHTSGQHIAVGYTCLENRFERATADFQALRRNAQLDRQRQRILTARAKFVEDNPDLAFMNLHPTARELQRTENDGSHFTAYDEAAGASRDNAFIADVARKLVNYGELSERQVDAVRRSHQRDAEFAARKAAEALEPREPVPAGRVQIVGTVVSTKIVNGDYGSTLKMLVKDDRGFKVWGTVPKALEPRTEWDEVTRETRAIDGVDRGDRVTFAAQVQPSGDDEYFGFFKRPTRAQVIA